MTAMPLIAYILTALVAYLFGSIPFGYLIARSRGVDIRSVGSRNIGATNVFRSLGKGPGTLTFLLDVGKGLAGARLIPAVCALLVEGSPEGHRMPLALLGAALAMAGHNWTIFLGFRGGKGAATGIGILFGLAWQAALPALGIWVAVLFAFGYVSLATISAAAGMIPIAWLLYFEGTPESGLLPGVLSLLGAITILRHHANIRRLANGTESRMVKRKSIRNPPENQGESS